MYKVVSLLALCLALAQGGVVNPAYRCGGVGTPVQLRISDCEGHCTLVPGRAYEAEEDFIPSSASPSLTLKVEIIHLGTTFPIIDTVLPNSSVQPGIVYTARFTVVPNDILSGNTVEFRGSILHTDSQLLEICVAADVTIT